MEEQSSRRLPWILGWIVAAILLVLFIGSKFEISFREKDRSRAESTNTQGSMKTPTSEKSLSVAPPSSKQELSTEELFAKAGPSVVLIEVFDDEGHKKGIGSGFVASDSGAIITNYHVIRGAARAVAQLPEGSSAQIAGVVGYDPDRDVAVIQASGDTPAPLKLGNSDEIDVGERVTAIGGLRLAFRTRLQKDW